MGLDGLEQLGATVDAVSKQLFVSMRVYTGHGRNNLATVSRRAKKLPVHNNLTAWSFAIKQWHASESSTSMNIRIEQLYASRVPGHIFHMLSSRWEHGAHWESS